MSEAYWQAYELTREKTGEVDTYPLLNYPAARVVRRRKRSPGAAPRARSGPERTSRT